MGFWATVDRVAQVAVVLVALAAVEQVQKGHRNIS
jgi:hypothetical protein